MPISRSLIAVACLAGLVAVPGAAGAQKSKSARSHVIKTPKGNQLAVPITVRYKIDGKGQSLKRARLAARLSIAAKLPGGRVLRTSESRGVPGAARVRLDHHPFFSVRQTRVLRKALAAKQKVKLAVASSLRADLDGNGRTDARSAQTSAQVLTAPTAEKPPAPVAHQRGDDPCGVLGQSPATCVNVTGRTFTARHFWDSADIDITCPRAFPYTTGSVSTQTRSKLFSQTANVSGLSLYGQKTEVLIIDDNTSGHPYSYTPTTACATTNLDPDV